MAEQGKDMVLKLAQISDTHISDHRNLLEPMIEAINRDPLDLVVITGDVVNGHDKKLFDEAASLLNKIRHRVIAIPGDYDSCQLWDETFGDRYKSIKLNGYHLDFLDTSFMKHRFAVGWGDVLKTEDPQQHEWLMEKLKEEDGYHMIFSHHPIWVTPSKEGDQYLRDNVRCVYSGHYREPIKFYFRYTNPRRDFPNGFVTTPMKFHGNSCYMIIVVNEKDEIVNIPKAINMKRTAW